MRGAALGVEEDEDGTITRPAAGVEGGIMTRDAGGAGDGGAIGVVRGGGEDVGVAKGVKGLGVALVGEEDAGTGNV